MVKIAIPKGTKYGHLTVLREVKPYVSPKGEKCRRLRCRCDCRDGTIKDIRLDALKSRATVSCGCHMRKVTREANLGNEYTKTHGWGSHPLYKVWSSMIARCTNTKHPHYKDYGGRGIRVCRKWLDNVDAFCRFALKRGWQEGLQIDRKDNDGDYTPRNCRFITKSKNLRNTRGNRLVKIDGKEMSLIEAHELHARKGIAYHTAYQRIVRLGWDPYLALTTPNRRRS